MVVVGWLKVLDGFTEKMHDMMPIGAHSDIGKSTMDQTLIDNQQLDGFVHRRGRGHCGGFTDEIENPILRFSDSQIDRGSH